jgi:putative DNA primase/helicase
VVAALQARGLWPEKPAERPSTNGHKPPQHDYGHDISPQVTYDYTDAHGQLLYQVLRYPPLPNGKKVFKQRRPAQNGGWTWNLTGVERVPYRLPEVVARAREGKTVLIAEGEKDCDNLRRLGCVATCNSGGAGKWDDAYAQYLRGASVIILPDNDEPGEEHAQEVARSLYGVARMVRVVHLPNLLPKGDVSDWIEAGGTLAELVRLAKETPAWVPVQTEETEVRRATDTGNAERLAAWHGHELRYSYDRQAWYVWTGTHWEQDDARVQQIAKATVMAIHDEVSACRTKSEREELSKHAISSESNAKRSAMLALAQSEPGIPVRMQNFDTDPWLLNCANGVVDLRTGELLTHKPERLLTRFCGVEYDPCEECPYWEQFLAMIIPDAETRAYVQRAVGYSLTGLTDERVMFILHGVGRNGKTTFIETVANLVGTYAVRTPTSTLMVKQQGTIPNDIARLAGARYVYASEAEDGQRLAESMVKSLTGGDTISARFLHGEWFDFKPVFKIWLATNHKPRVRGTDQAIWDRLPLIPFTVRIPDDALIPRREIDRRFEVEARGILSWAVEGCLRWQREGLGAPPQVREATSAYREDMDPLKEFLDERCVISGEYTCGSTELYTAYAEWARVCGERAMNHKDFSRHMAERGFASMRGKHGMRLQGIGLLDRDNPGLV